MKVGYRKQIGILMFVSTLLAALIYLSTVYPIEMGICKSHPDANIRYSECLFSPNNVAENVFFPVIAILLTLIPLYYLKESIYRTWRKFTLIYLPIAGLLIYLSPQSTGGAFISVGFSREITSFWLALLFIFISFLVMIGVFERQNVEKRAQ